MTSAATLRERVEARSREGGVMRATYLCNTVEPHPFIPDPDDAWKPDNERECAYCTRFPRDWEHKIKGRYRREPEGVLTDDE